MDAIVILNDKGFLHTQELKREIVDTPISSGVIYRCTPIDKYLIVGLIINGGILDPRTTSLDPYNITHLEKYLMICTNIVFRIPENNYRQEQEEFIIDLTEPKDNPLPWNNYSATWELKIHRLSGNQGTISVLYNGLALNIDSKIIQIWNPTLGDYETFDSTDNTNGTEFVLTGIPAGDNPIFRVTDFNFQVFSTPVEFDLIPVGQSNI